MISIDYLVQLVSGAAKGKDNFKEGAIGFNGYGFVFKDYDNKYKNSFTITTGSSKLCSFGAFKNIYKKFMLIKNKKLSLEKLMMHDPKVDLYFGGALKYLIPELFA